MSSGSKSLPHRGHVCIDKEPQLGLYDQHEHEYTAQLPQASPCCISPTLPKGWRFFVSAYCLQVTVLMSLSCVLWTICAGVGICFLSFIRRTGKQARLTDVVQTCEDFLVRLFFPCTTNNESNGRDEYPFPFAVAKVWHPLTFPGGVEKPEEQWVVVMVWPEDSSCGPKWMVIWIICPARWEP